MNLRLVLAILAVCVLALGLVPGLTQAAFASPVDTWCITVNDKLTVDSAAGRVFVPDSLNARLKNGGGRCEVIFANPIRFALNNSQGEVWLDGTRLTNWLGELTGRHLVIIYQANNSSNGFEMWVKNPSPTATPTPTPTPWPFHVLVPFIDQRLPAATTEFRFESENPTLCTVYPNPAPPGSTGSFHYPMQRNDNRIWMDEELLQEVKRQWRSTCHIYFTSRTLFLYDSAVGTIFIDGQPHPTGNRMPGVGTRIRVSYEAGPSNGLAVYKRS